MNTAIILTIAMSLAMILISFFVWEQYLSSINTRRLFKDMHFGISTYLLSLLSLIVFILSSFSLMTAEGEARQLSYSLLTVSGTFLVSFIAFGYRLSKRPLTSDITLEQYLQKVFPCMTSIPNGPGQNASWIVKPERRVVTMISFRLPRVRLAPVMFHYREYFDAIGHKITMEMPSIMEQSGEAFTGIILETTYKGHVFEHHLERETSYWTHHLSMQQVL